LLERLINARVYVASLHNVYIPEAGVVDAKARERKWKEKR